MTDALSAQTPASCINRSDIIRMAREANLPSCHTTHLKALRRFAVLVAAHEREKPVQVSPLEFVRAHPQQRPWVGLTDEDKAEILSRKWWNFEDEFDLAGFSGLIEAKLKEKNGG